MPAKGDRKIEWHPGDLFPRFGFIATILPLDSDWVVRFCNQRRTAEQHIKDAKYAFRWMRLSCLRFRDDWSLTSLQLKLIKIGSRGQDKSSDALTGPPGQDDTGSRPYPPNPGRFPDG